MYLSDCVVGGRSGGTFNAATGKAPCAECNTCATNGIQTACTKNANTVCNAA